MESLFLKISAKLIEGHSLRDCDDILKKYHGNDWKDYLKFDDKSYTRNIVFKNKHIEIVVICWGSNQKSHIHNHPKNGCLVKLVHGCLREDIYVRNNKLECTKSNKLKVGDVSYQCGKNGIHAINNDHEKLAVTIHIYSPPNYVPDIIKD